MRIDHPPLSLYIHLPWCIRKCPYCDFNSHSLRTELPEQSYCEQLIIDLEHDLRLISERNLISIFFGGGTPSLFSATSIDYILNNVQKRIPFSDNIEITLEANPGTVDAARFRDFFHAGINRLSLGIQSFQHDKLKILGRIHDGHQAIAAIDCVRNAGFDNFNLDLMHGLPSQSVTDALFDLQTALSHQPRHLSWYQLTIEPHTQFAHQPPQLPDEEILWEIQCQGQQLLAQQNYPQYEISAYAAEKFHCLHNKNYWKFGDYLGIGAGAHSKITYTASEEIIRTHKVKNPKDYLNCQDSFIAQRNAVSKTDLPYEFMLNALRLYQPISLALFKTRTGLDITSIETALDAAEKKGLLHRDREKIILTELGHRFYNDLVSLFLP